MSSSAAAPPRSSRGSFSAWRCGRPERCAILFADLDGLKKINDTLGHEQGDRAIRTFAEVLRNTLRTTDVTARLGGDEVVALLYDVTPDHSAAIEARLREAIAARNAAPGAPFELGASVGFALSDADDKSTSLEDLMQRADEAMYARKQARRAARA